MTIVDRCVDVTTVQKKGGEGGCYKVVSTDNMNKNCKGDDLGVFFVILTAAS